MALKSKDVGDTSDLPEPKSVARKTIKGSVRVGASKPLVKVATAKAPKATPISTPTGSAVELGKSREIFAAEGLRGVNLYLAHRVAPKYPDKRISWVNTKEVRQRYRGYVPLVVDYERDTLEEAKTLDEAEKTTGNTLCWIDRAAWESMQAPDRQLAARIRNEVTSDSSEKQVAALREIVPTLDGLSIEPLGAKRDVAIATDTPDTN